MEPIAILIKIYDFLPENIVNDVVFNGLWNDVLGNIGDKAFFVGAVMLRKDIYERVIEECPKLKNCVGISPDKIIHFMFIGKKNIIFTIMDKEFVLDLSIKSVENHIETLTFYARHYDDIGRVEVSTTITDEENNFRDYSCDIKYLDEEGNEDMTLENEDRIMGIEKEKDVIFSTKFCVPLALARVFRKNFKNHWKEISRLYSKTMMEREDDALEDDTRFLFSKPFLLRDLKEVIIKESQENIIRELQDLGYDVKNYSYGVECPQRLDTVIRNLIQYIGLDAEVVVSDNIMQNFYFVLENIVGDAILTKGMIIKKEGDKFILYMVQIENDYVSVIPQVIDEKMKNSLFNRSVKNKEVEGLKEFLGIELSR